MSISNNPPSLTISELRSIAVSSASKAEEATSIGRVAVFALLMTALDDAVITLNYGDERTTLARAVDDPESPAAVRRALTAFVFEGVTSAPKGWQPSASQSNIVSWVLPVARAVRYFGGGWSIEGKSKLSLSIPYIFQVKLPGDGASDEQQQAFEALFQHKEAWSLATVGKRPDLPPAVLGGLAIAATMVIKGKLGKEGHMTLPTASLTEISRNARNLLARNGIGQPVQSRKRDRDLDDDFVKAVSLVLKVLRDCRSAFAKGEAPIAFTSDLEGRLDEMVTLWAAVKAGLVPEGQPLLAIEQK